jgi:hypothetical protein
MYELLASLAHVHERRTAEAEPSELRPMEVAQLVETLQTRALESVQAAIKLQAVVQSRPR